MHPIEWLRAIARSEDVPHGELAGEAAAALAALADDPLGMVPACRRLLDRHPEVGPLWWACARMLSAADGYVEARAIQSDLAADQLGLSLALDLAGQASVCFVGWSPLAEELAERRSDLDVEQLDGDDGLGSGAGWVVLVEPWAVGDGGFLVPKGVSEAVVGAGGAGAEVWLLVGVGRRLPEPLFKAMRRRSTGSALLTRDDVTRVVEPLFISCPCPPELL